MTWEVDGDGVPSDEFGELQPWEDGDGNLHDPGCDGWIYDDGDVAWEPDETLGGLTAEATACGGCW